MRAPDVLGFAAGALRGHRLRTGLSLLGVAIGVASVILLTSLGEGARLYVTGQFAQLGTNLLIVLPGKTETTGAAPLFGGTPNPITLDDVEALRRHVPSIRRIAPITVGEADVSRRGRTRAVTVIGTTSELREVRHLQVQVGRFLPAGDPERGARVCVIGAALQRELFGGANPLGEIVHVGGTPFRVIGVLDPRGVSLGMDMDEVVEMPVSQAMDLFDQPGLFRLMIEVSSHADIPRTRDEVVRVLSERHGEEDITAVTQDAVLSAFSSIVAVLTAALAGIAAVSLTVAGVAIMNVMLVSVAERRREVGLLKALGATRRQVVAAFLIEATLLSTSGGLLGLLLGLAGGAALELVYPNFPVQPPWWGIPIAVTVSVAVGMLFGALPARRAAGLDPVAALAGR